MSELKQRFLRIYSSRKFQIYLDFIRIALVLLLLLILGILLKEIEAVKMLAYDPCKICMEKTGCSCFCSTLK